MCGHCNHAGAYSSKLTAICVYLECVAAHIYYMEYYIVNDNVIIRSLIADPEVSMKLYESGVELDTAWS